MANPETVDILIIGSGMGGRPAPPVSRRPGLGSSSSSAALACAIAPLRATPARFSSGASFGHRETWLDGAGQPFNPGNYYYVVGSSKLYGAVLLRYRAEDFTPIDYREGATPGWPFPYDELERSPINLYHIRRP